ncbi:hypothetical protein GLOIN_2v1662624 [Rhizophagus irregularis DAOM 181602=DAOM 197198]|uniref:Uncharacterized protein n=1 Tax=Rhizophagus irregularis (strain DAOM 181602 / DAOM 197198 / MUCL 43194) TaxID=747089 RepID=A0A2P4PK78_RHIID|nr:hypothetical protein GLOIN_2v1662624 [Rhizophagus irregularis DAOM 181602=DAOM 197198]POG65803.1 hypothetical protein GLOIN_2v1662624 [Rhizophagus irregularis DAOM 181602=DAOM 197198]|eukprot:XP_025172669.1 hypothetical protein GLOIN_2v1662624 [Rhizophagus irregularis DAOM 181602=DAOM 197198]
MMIPHKVVHYLLSLLFGIILHNVSYYLPHLLFRTSPLVFIIIPHKIVPDYLPPLQFQI